MEFAAPAPAPAPSASSTQAMGDGRNPTETPPRTLLVSRFQAFNPATPLLPRLTPSTIVRPPKAAGQAFAKNSPCQQE
ncbi:hypothetical protein E4U53_000295, partial [Claviceps sorghi]